MVGQGRSRCSRRLAFRVGRRGKTTAVLLVGLLVVVAGFEGSYALWKATVPLGAGLVQAADFRVEMKNLNGTSVNMPDGVNLSEGQDQKPLFPGDSLFSEVVLQNRGTARDEAAKVQVSLAGRPYAVDTQDKNNRHFAGNLELAVASGSVTEGCAGLPVGRYQSVPMSGTGKPGEQFDVSPQKRLFELEKGTQSKVCFRVTLKRDAPSAAQGRLATVTVPLQADQVAP